MLQLDQHSQQGCWWGCKESILTVAASINDGFKVWRHCVKHLVDQWVIWPFVHEIWGSCSWSQGVQEQLDCWELVWWRNEWFLNAERRWLGRCHWWCVGPDQRPEAFHLALPLPREIYRVWEAGHTFWQNQHQQNSLQLQNQLKPLSLSHNYQRLVLTGTLTHFDEWNDWLTAEEAYCLGLVGQETFTWPAWPQ